MNRVRRKKLKKNTKKKAGFFFKKRFISIVVGILMILAILFSVYFVSIGETQVQKSVHPLAYSEIVERESQNYGLDPLLVYSVMKAESNFDAQAISRSGAMGLMQIMPETYEWLASKVGQTETVKEDLLNPEINIKYGCLFLSILMKKYPQLKSVLAAYNAGPGNVDSWLDNADITPDGENLENIPFSETRQYTEKVMNYYQTYQRVYGESNS